MNTYYLKVTTLTGVINIEINSIAKQSDDDILDFSFDIPNSKMGKILSRKPKKIHKVIGCKPFSLING